MAFSSARYIHVSGLIAWLTSVSFLIPVDAYAATTVTFNCTGGQQTWVVPAGETSIQIEATGARGGGGGGLGAWVTGVYDVTPGETLYIRVGCQGGSSAGGYNGGGDNGEGYDDNGYGGGGASDVRQGGTAAANRIIVAGGGGGLGASSGKYGGDGGAPNGGNGGTNATRAGKGATTTTNGAGGSGDYGNGGAGNASGIGGTGGGQRNAEDGGGGGGGGYRGGGGGGDCDGNCSAGGGGGSSYVGSGTVTGYLSGVGTGHGVVKIIYPPVLPVPDTISDLTVSGSVYADGQAVLTWSEPEDFDYPITDYEIEYSTDEMATWTPYADGISTATTATVTGLSNSAPGYIVYYRVMAVNDNGTADPSNTPYSFPFDAEDVSWWYYSGNAQISGNTLQAGSALSSNYIDFDGGVEFQMTSTYDGCYHYAPCDIGIGLSSYGYGSNIPQYAFHLYSTGDYEGVLKIKVNGANVQTLVNHYHFRQPSQISGVFRVERVGTQIKFYWNDSLQYTYPGAVADPLYVDGYVEKGSGDNRIYNTKIYGAGIQEPPDAIYLEASPFYGDGQISLNWVAPPDNGSPISDYNVDLDAGAGWQTYAHSPITGSSVTVTGLDNNVPGQVVWFRIQPVNGEGAATRFSNTVYGFPFPAVTVNWRVITGDAQTGGGTFNGQSSKSTGESSRYIGLDGGVQAGLYIDEDSCGGGGFYVPCEASFGLSPQGYAPDTPKYAIRFVPTGEYAGELDIYVNGAKQKTLSSSSHIWGYTPDSFRVERVGTDIKFYQNDNLQYTYSGAVTEELFGDVYTEKVSDILNAKIYGGKSALTAANFNAVETEGGTIDGNPIPSHVDVFHGGSDGSPSYSDPVDGKIHTKVVGQEFYVDIVALDDSDDVVTNFANEIDHEITMKLISGAECDPANPGFNSIINLPSITFAKADYGVEHGRKPVALTINQAVQDARLWMQDTFDNTFGCSSDTFTVRPERYTLFAGHGDGVTAGQIPANATPGDVALNNSDADSPDLDGSTVIHKAGQPFRLRVRAVGSDLVTPAADFNTDVGFTIAAEHSDMTVDGGLFQLPYPGTSLTQVTLTHGTTPDIDNVFYNEVGIIGISIADDDDYASGDRDLDGTGDGSTTDELEIMGANASHAGDGNQQLVVGRFVPDHFTINDTADLITVPPIPKYTVIVNAGIDGTFTYIGQSFGVSINDVIISARNADTSTNPNGNITRNYQGAFWKLDVDTVLSYSEADNAGQLDSVGGNVTLAGGGLDHDRPAVVGADGDGTVTLDFAEKFFNYDRPDLPVFVNQFTADINLTIDGITDGDAIKFPGTIDDEYDLRIFNPLGDQRYGRVKLFNDTGSEGPENIPHTATVRMQYIDNTGAWTSVNTEDTCGGNCADGFGIEQIFLNGTHDNPVDVGSGSTTMNIDENDWDDASPGTNQFTFTATDPGTGKVIVSIDSSALPGWLEPTPNTVEVTFGTANSANNIMYQRELWR